MRVLLVAPQSFFNPAGTPINVLQMCRALTDLGYRVHLATFPFGQDVDLAGLVHHRAPRIPLVKRIPVGFSFAKLVYDPILAFSLLGLLIRYRFRAVHAIEEAAFFAVPLARLFGVPAISDLDSDLCRQLAGHRAAAVRCLAGAAGWLRRLALRQSAAAITVARHLTELVAETSPGTPVFEIRDIPLEAAERPAAGAAVERLRAELGLADKRIVVYTGNFDSRQGVELLVDAMPAVLQRFPDAMLLLVGGEPDRIAEIDDRAAGLGVAGAVVLAGKRPPETMPEFMALADVLASPRLEPLVTPLKVYTYMSSGRPMVATDLPTHTQVLDETSAILVAPTAEGMAAGFIRALDDPAAADRLGAEARRAVAERHNYEAFRVRLGEAYAAAIGNQRPAPAGHGKLGAD